MLHNLGFEHAPNVQHDDFVYAYGDWLTRAGDLTNLASEAGLTVTGADGQQAALVVMDGSPRGEG